ncbi:KdsC family phosphatase [Marinomonas mediterranea]|jgi:HAD-superfamily hydrolase, subfamily IIIA|uniref:3-deoxy-D-manno-octulosonate 8-phosphate phosphatase KdsC n=1 Tax=Marinomonas mediterranea (strain ATCC 700492 / JCM 21426 / NBRC 103028 / MMB-1) TaxID=717774 RepID=F2K4U7_MARM1|nr:HAD-IIIA family hydrolase [Marinomonas mediterranea]ADZ92590.1 3-deoxy-D-manno-octulosonate 8-phosphate phosphatase, YrbI family [Marinomonas mediterranea MMB-1]WCN10533.1 HAD-IIIA family hydrolase [Marinomonas mediterranea]WCN14583.1 HAD-IIIA family hydrolase [Marinomonas mediterranea]WCN18632.1 HAD-IIIA family hydrolase [Marinomonas mediterranea MMB-1]
MDTQFLSQYKEISEDPSFIERLQVLSLVIFDVDGVLTDGSLFYSGSGEEVKCFNVKDGVAMKLLPKWGVDVGVITAKDSAPLRKRMEDLGVKHFYPGCHDKAAAFKDLQSKLNIKSNNIAYVGDDVVDLQVMPLVGVSICPSDAHLVVARYCDVRLNVGGGKGAAREVADLVLASKMPLEKAYDLAMQPEFESKQN